MHFTKLQGLGNDFLLVDLRNQPNLNLSTLRTLAERLCDRHFGVGGDGILALSEEGSLPRMTVVNADGSLAEMCGNGLRCVARYLWDHDPGERAAHPDGVLPIRTGAGILSCKLHLTQERSVQAVEVRMGIAHFPEGAQIQPYSVLGKTVLGTRVSMGNPHLVIFLEEGQDLFALAREVGKDLSTHPLFPEGTNVEFATLHQGSQAIDLVVWERGASLTLACGTGACATVAAACALGRRREGTWQEVLLPGGSLQVQLDPETRALIMVGPALEVFQGTLSIGG